jgi:hypothetical protein
MPSMSMPDLMIQQVLFDRTAVNHTNLLDIFNLKSYPEENIMSC